MICQITETVDGHIFDISQLFVCVLGKEPADCKLILETV